MIGLLLDWLEKKANDYLVWCHERRVEVASVCPDCELPEPHCYCDEKYDEDRRMDDAFYRGAERAWREAERELGGIF